MARGSSNCAFIRSRKATVTGLPDSGIPRLVKDPTVRNAIIQQITAATALYGLPTARFNLQNGAAVLTNP